jgi:hypothetical protein
MKHLFIRTRSALLPIFVTLCSVLIFSVLPSPSVQAQSATRSATPIKECVLTNIALHGSKPATITCAKWGQKQVKSSAIIHPGTTPISCSAGWWYEISNGTTTTCFTGTGYLAYRMNNINYINSVTSYPSWLRIYPNGSTNGCYLNIHGFAVAGGFFIIDGTHSITQIDIGANQTSATCF